MNHIDVLIKEDSVKEDCKFMGFYGSPYSNHKIFSWNLLRKLGQEQNHPWLVSGDFNEIMYSFEKSGAKENGGLSGGFRGMVWFTWERGNLPETKIEEKLDRGVANKEWMNLFPMGSIQHLPYSMSDHCPLLLHTNSGIMHTRSLKFKFEAWWTMDESFEKKVKVSWKSSTGTLIEKLESLQLCLKRWASTIKRGREGLKRKLTRELASLLEKERDDETMAKTIDTKIHLNMEIDKDEMYWEQRARANWLRLGDKNSAFFHKCASVRKRSNTIYRLESDEGREITDDSEIKETATSFFQELFTTNGVKDPSHLLMGIENKISLEFNTVLLSLFTAEKVQTALKGMGPTKAPRPDDFPVLFFSKVMAHNR
ncbi:reverse transcriptase [Gossypium australe]|uniref:Reverse transcriptase n=1 Tax=Gossypium australe TaxID=47621 RepID=A0A5B6USU6_9ROSI|nr:reverse transcriptase [Gossypium australe]